MGKGKPRIRPSQPLNRGGKIVPHVDPVEGSTNDYHPTFNLEHLGGKYCLSNCTAMEKAAFADTLHKIGRLNWGEIQRAPRHGCGTEIIARHSLGDDRRYPDEVTDDVNILAFRFFGKASMVGYRIGRVFTILFLDRDFTLYDHG